MKNGTCPKCGSAEILGNLPIHGGDGFPPYVIISEPEPANRPFIWLPETRRSSFQAYLCGACGYTEIYADAFQALNEGREKGYQGS